jgi:ABC-type sugar transport system permease subunit
MMVSMGRLLPVAAILVVVVQSLVGLLLALLLRRSSSTVSSAVLATFAVLPFIRPASITLGFDALMSLLRRGRM